MLDRLGDQMGQQLGNYRLIRLLGQGSFADVYFGEHVYLKTQVAIKVLRIQLANDEQEGFLNEARTIAALEHPHIVRVLEFGIENSTPFLVMSYAPNGTLRQLFPKGTSVSPMNILPYVAQLAEALQYAHDRNLVHRDIKPENMLLGRNNEVLLGDFGIAQILESSRSGGMVGSVAYMAPEQFQGKPRPASDQYALGVVIYEWLCGECPFYGNPTQVADQHRFATPPSLRLKVPAIPPDLELVMLTALAKDPQQRFANMKAFVTALEQACLPAQFYPFAPPVGAPPPSQPLLSHPEHSPGQPPWPSGGAPPPSQPSWPSTGMPPPSQALWSPAESLPSEPRWPSGEFSSPSRPLWSSAARPPGGPLQSPMANRPRIPRPPPPEQGISRRSLLVGLAAVAGLAAVGGGAWLLFFQGPKATPLGTTLFTYHGHTDFVLAVGWSPDSKRIASGSLDKTVQVWDATTGNNALNYTGHTSGVEVVAWSPDGKRIASGSLDKTVQVWDAATRHHLLTYSGHPGSVYAAAWSPDGKRIASAGKDKTVQVWEAATGHHLLTYKGHSDTVGAVAWSPDGKHIVSASADKMVQVWDAATGHRALTYKGHSDKALAVAWAPDSKRIASGSNDKTVQMWDAVTGHLTATCQGHTKPVETVAWSPDSNRLISGSDDQTARIWDASTGSSIYTYSGHSDTVWAVAWSHDGQQIASASGDHTVQVWQAV